MRDYPRIGTQQRGVHELLERRHRLDVNLGQLVRAEGGGGEVMGERLAVVHAERPQALVDVVRSQPDGNREKTPG